MSMLSYAERQADPRCVMAAQLFEASVTASGRLGAGHARDNMLYALQMSVLTPEESGYQPDRHASLMESTVNGWIKQQFRATWLAELQRIQRSVQARYPA